VAKPWNAAWLAKPKLPIQIRADLSVLIVDLPADLTIAEAEKIGRVIRAMAVEPQQ